MIFKARILSRYGVQWHENAHFVLYFKARRILVSRFLKKKQDSLSQEHLLNGDSRVCFTTPSYPGNCSYLRGTAGDWEKGMEGMLLAAFVTWNHELLASDYFFLDRGFMCATCMSKWWLPGFSKPNSPRVPSEAVEAQVVSTVRTSIACSTELVSGLGE